MYSLLLLPILYCYFDRSVYQDCHLKLKGTTYREVSYYLVEFNASIQLINTFPSPFIISSPFMNIMFPTLSTSIATLAFVHHRTVIKFWEALIPER